MSIRIALAVLALGLAGAAQAQTAIKVGSKNFTEQYVVGEMYAAALEAAGVKVERKINLGGTLVAHAALTKGEIDLYPEYTGTGLLVVMKAEAAGGPDAVYNQVRAHYEKEWQVTWLKPSRVNNGYAMLVRAETAAQYNLRKFSDVAPVAGRLKLGGGPELADRKDGIPGYKERYGIVFGEFRQFASYPLRYKALEEKQIDILNGFSTDWQIAAAKHVALEDDKGLFPPYYLTAAARQAALSGNPAIAPTLDKVNALLDNATMQELNRQVEVDKKEPRAVAQAFLRAKGLIK